MRRGILTVLSPAPDHRLAAVDDVRLELGLVGNAHDADLDARIGQASDAISTACGGRVFGREILREVFRLDAPTSAIMLSRAPVSAISSLTEGSTLLVDGVDFEVDRDAGLVHRLARDARARWCGTKITVEYAAGWILPSQAGCDLPADIRRVCIVRVARSWNGKGRDAALRSEGSQDVGQVSYFDPDKLSEAEARELGGYRRICL